VSQCEVTPLAEPRKRSDQSQAINKLNERIAHQPQTATYTAEAHLSVSALSREALFRSSRADQGQDSSESEDGAERGEDDCD
jgi:hypothetical protein